MYGLVGKKLKHSFSREIHNYLGNQDYQLFETNNIEDFLKHNDFKGFNITIPFKTDIIPYLDDLDPIAKETYSVNTVINNAGRLVGYNTDYSGLKSTLEYFHVSIINKKVLIIGNGSVSKTVIKLMQDMHAKSIVRLGRSIKSNMDHLIIEYINYLHYDIIINTTPVGMYPNNDDELLINISAFTNLVAVIDLVYNPLRTKLLVEATKKRIQIIDGLYMLIMQAVKAHELFFEKNIPLNVANKIYKKIYRKHLNIIFIGLPLSGKSKYARLLGSLTHKKCLDTDQIIEKETKMTIPNIFEIYGEPHFRNLEAGVVKDLYKLQNLVISTGGGLVENQTNMDLLRQNGIIIFLDKSPEIIAEKTIHGRPLLKQSRDIIALAERRMPMYLNNSDIIINLDKDTETHLQEIKEKIDEYISGQRS